MNTEGMSVENKIKVNLVELLWENEKKHPDGTDLGEAGIILPCMELDAYDENCYLSIDIDEIQYDIEIKRIGE